MSTKRRLAACCLLPLCLAISTAHASTSPEELTAKFAAMNGPGWTGGDASWSAQLPDGRTVWLFGDTLMGGVDALSRRDRCAPLVRNSMVVEERDGTMRTVSGRDGDRPGALVRGSGPNDWYWPGPPVVGQRILQVPMAHIVRTGPGNWDFKAVGTALAVFSLPSLALRSVSPLETPDGVNMASAAVTAGQFTYIFGTRDTPAHRKRAFEARAPAGDLAGSWSYWDGDTWTASPASAAAVLDGVSDQFSVVRTGHRWVLISQVPMRPDVIAFDAHSPHGPWRRLGVVARVPDVPHALTYNATIHEEYSNSGELLLGYNVLGDDMDAVASDAGLYRPRFMTIKLPPVRA